jgi:Tfp pilus assembly protein PilE
VAVAVLSLLALPSVAQAQEASEQAAAQALFDEGLRLFGEEQYGESCAKFEASLALIDAMGTRGKLAECYEKVGRTASAWAAYREVAVLAKRAGQVQREEIAAERAARLQATLSYLTIIVPEAVRITGLRIEQNGVALNSGAYGTAIATDPGLQTIRISAEGYQAKTLTVELGKSQQERLEVPLLEALTVEAPPEPEPGVVTVAAPPVERPTSTLRIAAYSSLAVGGGSVVLAAVLGLKAKSDHDAAFDDGRCNADNSCTPAGVKAIDDARSLANIGTAFAITGTVLIGAGAYLWLRSSNDSSHRDKQVRVVPSAGGDNLALNLMGRF